MYLFDQKLELQKNFRFGRPKELRCDNGTEFKGEVQELCDKEGIVMIRGRSYHPQTQGKVSPSLSPLMFPSKYAMENFIFDVP